MWKVVFTYDENTSQYSNCYIQFLFHPAIKRAFNYYQYVSVGEATKLFHWHSKKGVFLFHIKNILFACHGGGLAHRSAIYFCIQP